MTRDTLPHILAIDLGTSALKAVLYGVNGQVLMTSAARYEYQTPQPGWAEANPGDWWAALIEAVAALREAGFDLKAVQAIGLTGQMHSAVLLDEAGDPLPPPFYGWTGGRWPKPPSYRLNSNCRRSSSTPPTPCPNCCGWPATNRTC